MLPGIFDTTSKRAFEFGEGVVTAFSFSSKTTVSETEDPASTLSTSKGEGTILLMEVVGIVANAFFRRMHSQVQDL